MQIRDTSIKDFSGGLNNTDAKSTIGDNQATDLQNIYSDEVNGISCQPHPALVSSLPAGTGTGGAWTFKKNDGAEYLICCNIDTTGKIYYSQDAQTWTEAKDGDGNSITLDTNYIPEGVTFKDVFWLTDGNVQPLAFDGSHWYYMGSPYVKPDTAGTATGTFKYKVSFTYNGIEYLLDVPSFSTTTTNGVLVSNIPLGPNDTTKRTLYRSKDGVYTDFYAVPDPSNLLVNNTATTFTDDVADASLGGAWAADATHVECPIPKFHFPIIHQSRYFGIKTTNNPDFIYYSWVDIPYFFEAGNTVIAIPIEDEILWGGSSFKGDLIIPSERDMWVLSGDNIFNQFTLVKKVSGIGCMFHRSMQPYYIGEQQVLIFLSRQGWYVYDGSDNPRFISHDIDNLFNDLLQADITLGSDLETTQSDFQAGTLSADMDSATIPDSIFLAKDATLSAAGHDANYNIFQILYPGTAPMQYRASYYSFPGHTNTTYNVFYGYYGPHNELCYFNVAYNFTPIKANKIIIGIEYINRQAGVLPVSFQLRSSTTGLMTQVFIWYPPLVTGPNPVSDTFEIDLSQNNIGTQTQLYDLMRVYGGFHADFLDAVFLINDIKMYADHFKTSGSWISKDIDTTTASIHKWKTFLADYQSNNQNIDFSIASGASANPSTFVSVNSGDPIPAGNLDRHLAIKALFSMKTIPPAWTGKYDPNLGFKVPEQSTLNPWVKTGGGIYSVTFDTPGVNYLKVDPTFVAPKMPTWTRTGDAFNNTTGWTVGWKTQVYTNGQIFNVRVCDGTCGVYVSASPSQVTLLKRTTAGTPSAPLALYTITNKNVSHEYLLNCKTVGGNIVANVYVDGILVITKNIGNTNNWTGSAEIAFGSVGFNTTLSYKLYYLGWNTSGILAPVVSDDTTSPILNSTFVSWLVSSGTIFPENVISAINHDNRYICTGVEASRGENYNNIAIMLDKNAKWTLGRGVFIGAMTEFKSKLYLFSSKDAKVFSLDLKPAEFYNSSGYNGREVSYFRTKKFTFGTNIAKEFSRIQVRLKGHIKVRAYIDTLDNSTVTQSWEIGPSDGKDLKTMSFLSNGTQFGTSIMFEFTNDLGNRQTGSRNYYYLEPFEVYEFKVFATIHNERYAPVDNVINLVTDVITP